MIEISKIYFSLGNKIETNFKIEKDFFLKKGSINRLTGIKQRYISSKNETSENLAIKVCKKLTNSDLKDISHIISVSNTPSIKFPGISNYLSSYLKIKNVFCINLNAGCTGYVDAIMLAYDIMNNNKKSKILLITADTYSKFINKNNRSIKPLFSDGATASIVRYNKKGFKSLKRVNINIANSQKDLIFENKEIIMNGPAIVSLSLKYVVPEIKKNSKDVDSVFIHQAGKIVYNLIKSKINKRIFIPKNFEKFGNLVSSSIPVLLSKNFKSMKKSKKIILCGFGVGLSVSLLKLKR